MISQTSSAAQAASSAGDQQPPTQPSGAARLADTNTFLKLLVAQIRNQDPLNPADGTQFLTQLAQFTELEQMMGVKSELETIRKTITGESAADAA